LLWLFFVYIEDLSKRFWKILNFFLFLYSFLKNSPITSVVRLRIDVIG